MALFLCGLIAFIVVGMPVDAFGQPASCTGFTDTPLVPGTTNIKAIHFTELRVCINALRATRGLTPFAWTDPVIVPGQTVVRAAHLTELRSALGAVFAASELTPPEFGAAPTVGVTVIMASHIVAIRDAIATVPACAFIVSPQAGNVSGTASDVVVNVTTGAGCIWMPYEESEFASFASTVAVAGSGTATLQIVANETTAPRTITAVVAGTYVNMVQARAPCTFHVTPATATVGSGVSAVTFSIATNACAWTATESTSFASFSTESGTVSGSTTLDIAANTTSSARTVEAAIAGTDVTVTQAGLPCSPSLSAAGVTVSPAEQSGSVGLSIAPGCSWSTTSSASWLTPSPASGSGSATVTFSVAGNTGLERAATVDVNGVLFTVTQEVGCTFEFDTTPLTATTARLEVTTGPGCTWEASPDWGEATVTPASGVGSGEATIEIPEPADPSFLSEVELKDTAPLAAQSTAPNSIFNLFRCIDSRSWLCRVVVIITFQGGSFQGPSQGSLPPPLVATPSTIARGGSVTVALSNGSSLGPNISGWKFVPLDGGESVTRTSNLNSPSWNGVFVTSGTVSLTLNWQGKPLTRSATVTVTPRPGWTTAPPTPHPVANGFSAQLTVPDPPLPALHLGKYELDLPMPYGAEPITSGPNEGYVYVATHALSFSYRWTSSATILNLSPEFVAANCGSYHPQNNPAGFATAAQIRDDVIRHESGPVESHYVNFTSSLAQPATNPGQLMESRVGRQTTTEFIQQLDDELTLMSNSIATATDEEPCGGNPGGFVRDGACQILGKFNLFEYQQCQPQ